MKCLQCSPCFFRIAMYSCMQALRRSQETSWCLESWYVLMLWQWFLPASLPQVSVGQDSIKTWIQGQELWTWHLRGNRAAGEKIHPDIIRYPKMISKHRGSGSGWCFHCLFSNVFQCFPMLSNAFQCFPMFSNVFKCFPMFSNVFQCFPSYSWD